MTRERMIHLIGPDGQPMQMAWKGRLPRGSTVIPRLLDPAETISDPIARADWAAGAWHIVEARLIKYAEAIALLGGGTLQPGSLLLGEAADKGMAVETLAQLVLHKRKAFIAAELARQRGQAGQ